MKKIKHFQESNGSPTKIWREFFSILFYLNHAKRSFRFSAMVGWVKKFVLRCKYRDFVVHRHGDQVDISPAALLQNLLVLS